jgi:glycosyltransferase involved in cell wall biosynthesis
MKVLSIHNSHRFGSSSGDDIVFKKEIELLKTRGHDVFCYNPSNDAFDDKGTWGKFLIALQIPWSVSSARCIREIVRRKRPDVAHVHNFFPLISPSVYHVLQSEGVPIVQTLHDFRFLCVMAFFMRDGRICEECQGGSVFRSIRYACFKDSRTQTIPVAFMLKLHQALGTFKEKISAFICLTESQRKMYKAAGFRSERLFRKPHFIEAAVSETGSKKGDCVVFIGRLGEEKGIGTLIDAWRALPVIPLKVVGDGPDAHGFRRYIKAYGPNNVEFLGHRSHGECMGILARARFLIMPSICYETFGLVMVEAFSRGRPVIASRLGAMADIVVHGKTGLLFKPGDAADLAQKVSELWNDPSRCEAMGRAARREYEGKYTPESNYEMLMSIYRDVIERKKSTES